MRSLRVPVCALHAVPPAQGHASSYGASRWHCVAGDALFAYCTERRVPVALAFMRACARALFRRAETPIVAVRGRLELVKSIEDAFAACWCLCTARRATCPGPRFGVWSVDVCRACDACHMVVLREM